MSEPALPYDPDVETFDKRILEIDSTWMTYEQAFENPAFVDKALDLKTASDTGIPIEFTQYALRRLAVDEVDCSSFKAALDSRAKRYLEQLIKPEAWEKRQVHPGNADDYPSLFRSSFIKLFCHKTIANLQNTNCEHEKFNKLAQVFPFQVYKNVPEYKMDFLRNYDDDFYDRMQHFLDEHFDDTLPVCDTIALFLNNIRHFFVTKYSVKMQHSKYLNTFPKLNDDGIYHFQQLYREYANVRKHFSNCKRRVSHLYFEEEEFRTMMPERNIDEISSLLQSAFYRDEPEIYADIFEKYLFFFVHALQVENDSTPVFYIDDMIYMCLKSLKKFRTSGEDPINMVEDIAMLTVLCFLGHKSEVTNNDRYSINSTTLTYIKEYITSVVNSNIGLQSNFICELPLFVNESICLGVYYATEQYVCKKMIMYFLHQFICRVFSSEDDRIESTVCYSAYLGEESRFVIPRSVVESLRNFVLLSTKFDTTKVSHELVHNVFFNLLHDRLIISET